MNFQNRDVICSTTQVNITNECGNQVLGDTPLHEGINSYYNQGNMVMMVESLIRLGANVSVSNNKGVTPLHKAATEGNVEIAELLIRNKADVNAPDNVGVTPLHEAAAKGNVKIAEMLIRNKADVYAPGNDAHIPLSERKKVLQFSHDDKCSAHLGIHKTLAKIRQSYYWPGLQNDVRTYINGCDKCAKRKSPQKFKRATMALVGANGPMERIATYILGELPETESGNKYILVVSDYYTKWTESFAMPNMEAKTVAKIIVEEVIVRIGVPHLIHPDQGRQFESLLFQEMCCILNIKKTRTTPYHPKSDDMMERFNCK
ncbi:unnamed protein product [Mytilus edulis]|uniref:Integrase catalytic domain-containing protein n=1 Tax=Mytilus edulis TaxID=6550 RepID=A0A8S3SHB9_MYTED|nr:unnamed protein product [Mytilus edulis]